MNSSARTMGILGAATLAVALPVFAPAQQSDLTKEMGIDQNLGASVPKDVKFRDEKGQERTFGSLLQGRPVLVIPVPLRKQSGCGVVLEGLQKTLYRAENPNERKLIKKEGINLLEVGREFDIVVVSLDARETPTNAAEAKNAFHKALEYNAEPATFLTGDEKSIRALANAIGFRFMYKPEREVLNNPTGSVMLTPDGRISNYTIGKDFPTKVLEANVALAKTNEIGTKADDTQMFACVQLDKAVIARRSVIERYYTGGALVTLAGVIIWIGSMLRAERHQQRKEDLGGQPGGA